MKVIRTAFGYVTLGLLGLVWVWLAGSLVVQILRLAFRYYWAERLTYERMAALLLREGQGNLSTGAPSDEGVLH